MGCSAVTASAIWYFPECLFGGGADPRGCQVAQAPQVYARVVRARRVVEAATGPHACPQGIHQGWPRRPVREI
eukprot:2128472-Alexandrium_andersonii.AAC.1